MYWLQTSALDHYSHGETNYSQVKFRLNGSLWHLLNCRIYNQSPALVMTFNKVRVQLPSDSSICHFCKTDHFPTTGRLYFHSHEHAIRLQSLTSHGVRILARDSDFGQQCCADNRKKMNLCETSDPCKGLFQIVVLSVIHPQYLSLENEVEDKSQAEARGLERSEIVVLLCCVS